MTRTFPEPTPADLAALQQFANAHGRNWKSELSNVYWYNARLWRGVDGRDDVIGSTLHGIRNTFGPKWLYQACTIKPQPKPLQRVSAADIFTNPKGWLK